MLHVAVAKSDLELDRCFPLMQELRPQLVQVEFTSRIRRQEQQYGYQLAYLEDDEHVRTVAGFKISECLAWGKFLYVDDLVTQPSDRSKGYGEVMFNWLIEQAKSHLCSQLHLDSGVQRFGAHRFYLQKRMELTSHHFSIKL